MKFLNITLLFVIFALACHLSLTVAEEGTGAKRIALRRPVGKSAKVSSTTEAPAEEEEGDYAENAEEHQYPDEAEAEAEASSTTTTTTETPKRIGPVIRPFRSNDDFLNSLKRRQMNAKNNKPNKPAPKPSKPAAQDSQEEAEESAPVAAPAPSAKGFSKPNSALNRRKLNKPSKPEPAEEAPAAEETEQKPEEDAKPKRPLGRLALRKRN